MINTTHTAKRRVGFFDRDFTSFQWSEFGKHFGCSIEGLPKPWFKKLLIRRTKVAYGVYHFMRIIGLDRRLFDFTPPPIHMNSRCVFIEIDLSKVRPFHPDATITDVKDKSQ